MNVVRLYENEPVFPLCEGSKQRNVVEEGIAAPDSRGKRVARHCHTTCHCFELALAVLHLESRGDQRVEDSYSWLDLCHVPITMTCKIPLFRSVHW